MAEDNSNKLQPIRLEFFVKAPNERVPSAPVNLEEATRITLRCMAQFAEVRPLVEAGRGLDIVVNFLGRDYTAGGAKEIIRFLKLNIFSSNVIGCEFGGIVGRVSNSTLTGLTTLATHVSTTFSNSVALAFIHVDDDSVFQLVPLLTMPNLSQLYIIDSKLSPVGMNAVRDVLLKPVNLPNGTTNLTHIRLNGNRGRSSITGPFAEIVKASRNLTNIQFKNGNADAEGTNQVVKALASFISSKTLRRVDMEGCHMIGRSVDLLCGTLATLEHLEELNLRNCRLTKSQNDKIRHRFVTSGALQEENLLLSINESIVDDPIEFDMSQQLAPRVGNMRLG